MDKHTCPRRAENGMDVDGGPFVGGGTNLDSYGVDNSCDYCGSLNPDTFMARVRAGTVTLGATDKSYKVYVDNLGGESFKQSYRTGEDKREGIFYKDRTDWVIKDTDSSKFYFQHLDGPQRMEFVMLYNEGKLHFASGIKFYVKPFFMRAEK